MKKQLLFLITIVAVSACNFGNAPTQQTPNIFKDTLSFKYVKLNERAADCGNKADSACTVVKVSYPLFTGQDLLNDTVTRRLTNLFSGNNKPDTSVRLMAGRFLKNYADFKKDNPKSPLFYTLDSYCKVVSQDSALVALEFGGQSFSGGAHGQSFTGFFNWNPKTHQKVTLDDLFENDYKDQLKNIAERIFRKEEKLKDTSSLARDYFFKGNKFALNDNYLLTPVGIRFVYNEYEIKPYAAGQTELIIPYTAIKKLIRPKAVVAHYIN